MVEDIYNIKNEFIRAIEENINERGIDRIDVSEMSKLVDIVKDLAEAEKSCWEAEYYRGVSEAMESSGYDDMMGYSGNSSGTMRGSEGNRGNMGYRQSGRGSANQYGGSGGRRGYRMGYDMEGMKMAMQNADPQERERMKREMQQLMTSM